MVNGRLSPTSATGTKQERIASRIICRLPCQSLPLISPQPFSRRFLTAMSFPIVLVPTASVVGDEQLGSKRKFWYTQDDELWLFKESRDGTGEDWAEKLAYEVATSISIPAATVELAALNGRRGSTSRSFMPENTALVHGNEILANRILGYDREKKLRQSDHTFENIVSAIRQLSDDANVETLLEQLAGYLVLDALICNTDRHHENWGILFHSQVQLDTGQVAISYKTIAPSFDHASSLGRELRDERRLQIIQEKRIEDYIRRGRGGIYLRSTDPHGANPMHLIDVANRFFPSYFRPALKQVAQTPSDRLTGLADRVPDERISNTGRDFVRALLTMSHSMLTKLVE